MIEFYRKNRFILTIVAVVFVAFVFCFIYYYGYYDLFKLPFYASVWGTVSDWVMITVTFFTALYLVRTFKEQKRANDYQNDKHLKSIFPKFDLSQRGYDEDPIGFGSETIYYLFIKLNRNDARNLKVEKIHQKIMNEISGYPYFNEGEHFEFSLTSKIISEIDGERIPIFTLEFEDIEENGYSQTAFIKDYTIYFEKAVRI